MKQNEWIYTIEYVYIHLYVVPIEISKVLYLETEGVIIVPFL